MRKIKSEYDRFVSKVVKTDYCWEWVGSKYRFGYGHFRRKIDNKWVMYKAHRFSYEVHKGLIPTGSFVCHHCDNPSCVNPDHLFTGTAKENTDDMFRKGRKSRLIRNPKHRLLTLEIAKQIRQEKHMNPSLTLSVLADRYGTSIAQISRILLGHIWREEN